MNVTLTQILDLVGKLDDTPGDDTPRERFRRFLRDNVKEVGRIRDYVEECLRSSGDQYNRALQDLINYLGQFLGFEVSFGRYQGIQGQINFDGLWKSPTGLSIVVETKSTETYPIKTSTLVGYINELISEKVISDLDSAIGLYVIGRPDPEIKQLQNAIIAEKRTHQLRTISVESLLSLAELLYAYDVRHEDMLEVLKPSGPAVDPIVDLMTRLVVQPEEETGKPEGQVKEGERIPGEEAHFWLSPVKSDEEQTAEQILQTLVGSEKIYAFGERTPGRKHIKPGDWICFYATGKGVVAHARVASFPESKIHPRVRHAERYPWVFQVDSQKLYLEEPVVIDAPMRAQLDEFQGRDPNKGWAWFVQATRRISKRDFEFLTRR